MSVCMPFLTHLFIYSFKSHLWAVYESVTMVDINYKDLSPALLTTIPGTQWKLQEFINK